jgi:hypothetical protein
MRAKYLHANILHILWQSPQGRSCQLPIHTTCSSVTFQQTCACQCSPRAVGTISPACMSVRNQDLCALKWHPPQEPPICMMTVVTSNQLARDPMIPLLALIAAIGGIGSIAAYPRKGNCAGGQSSRLSSPLAGVFTFRPRDQCEGGSAGCTKRTRDMWPSIKLAQSHKKSFWSRSFFLLIGVDHAARVTRAIIRGFLYCR